MIVVNLGLQFAYVCNTSQQKSASQTCVESTV